MIVSKLPVCFLNFIAVPSSKKSGTRPYLHINSCYYSTLNCLWCIDEDEFWQKLDTSQGQSRDYVTLYTLHGEFTGTFTTYKNTKEKNLPFPVHMRYDIIPS